MALVLLAQSCGASLSEKCLRTAIAFEVERGYCNSLGRKMRFNNFLCSKLTKLYVRSKHKVSEKLLDELSTYETASISDRSKLLNKVSVIMGYNSISDLVENERVQKEAGLVRDTMESFDISMECKRFPSIILGNSEVVELYCETRSSTEVNRFLASHRTKEMVTGSIGAKSLDQESFSETRPSVYPVASCMDFSTLIEETSHSLPFSPQSLASERVEVPDLSDFTVGPAVPECFTSERAKVPDLSHFTVNPSNTSPKAYSSLEESNGESVTLVLNKVISHVAGLTSRQCRLLEKCGFHTLRKLLHHFPRTYADLQNAQFGIDDGQYLIFIGKILSSRGVKASYTFAFLEVIVACEILDNEPSSPNFTKDTETKKRKHIYLHLKKFFRGTRFTNPGFLKALQQKNKEGNVVCVSGKVKKMRLDDHYEMREFNMDVLEGEEDVSLRAEGRPYPIYPSKGGLNPNMLRDIISRALEVLPPTIDPIPEDVSRDFGLVSLYDAYNGIHQPKNLHNADSARKRLIFDEFFYIQLGRLFQMLEGLGTKIEKDVLLDKYRKPEVNAIFVKGWCTLTKNLLKALPYSLTPSQLTAIAEIIWDLKRPVPMNRLLQGDVGCGKTIVAFLACMEVIGSGYQAAFMVPTELLAVQHYEQFLKLLERIDDASCKPCVALLTGSTSAKQSRLTREGLRSGEISLIIGTHSLISENVEFSSLRIAVVDEQHRFGVIQRGRFNSKLFYSSISTKLAAAGSGGSVEANAYMAPHVLAMSATPIPRTLALALYGDMSLTQITDLPPGRIPVDTFIIEGTETGFQKVYEMMGEELKGGGKVYLVYPVIELSEHLPQLRAASAELEIISDKFSDYGCGLLHGKMKGDEKDEALRRFRSGETHILLSTQVIEVGVDVPDASMMVVMNSERFGMAQLHQLRGRVGRGERKSKCLLVASTTSSINRLKAVENSRDGFYLANMDLLLRGPGDLLGKKQSGHLPEFPIARLEMDGNILQDAHVAALRILGASHDLEQFPKLKSELSMRQPLSFLGD